MALFRDFDGRTRRVQASGRSSIKARQALQAKLQERATARPSSDFNGLTKFSAAAERWMETLQLMVADGRRSPGTVDTYERQLRNHVLPPLGELRLREITTPLVDRVIGTIRTEISPSTAKSAKSVISGVLGFAVRYGALQYNPVREIERIEAKPRRAPRGLTSDERVAFFTQLTEDPIARRKDLPELVFFMLATGVRIGEALATLWSDVDLDGGGVNITSTIVRVRGKGLVRKGTKSSAGERTLALPISAIEMLRQRCATGATPPQPVFPDTLGGFRDPANVRRDLRNARGHGDLSWVTSHAFRKTAATILDEAALSARLIADQLGHSRPSMTQDVYLARHRVDSQAADALESALRQNRPGSQKGSKEGGNEEGQNP
ncbi:tyrosine recombinase XerC [Mumia xiangluensis]